MLIIFLFLATKPFADAQSRQAFPRIEPDPKAFEYYDLGRKNKGYSWNELAQISLWASGDSAASNLEKINAMAAAIKNSPEFPSSNREKAEFILSYMHKNLLKSYSLYQTRIDTLFSNGRYNCVSSAVLYMILCKSAGIETSGVMTKEHAFVIVHNGGENIDVETTNAYGFDPGNRKEFHDNFGRLTGFTYVPVQNYRDRQTISQIELVSLILNNRVAENERQNRFIESVPVAIDRAALLVGNALTANTASPESETIFIDPRKDLMDRLFNFGAMLLRSGREEDALQWAAAASPVYPDESRWNEFILAAVNNNIVKLTRANKLSDARNFLEKNKALISEADYNSLDTTLVDRELLASANRIRSAADGDSVVSAINQAFNIKRIEEKRAVELLNFTVLKTAEVLSGSSGSRGAGRNWREAITYLENAIDSLGANRELEQALNTYRSNLATDYHNRFATEWNKKNYNEAERILNEGLALFPNDRQLLRNRDTLDRYFAH
jgi:tetratricopeptide (TPR) repeat protein